MTPGEYQRETVKNKKQYMNRLEKDALNKGCSKFKYRNNKAFEFEKQQMTLGVTVREENLYQTAMGIHSQNNNSWISQPLNHQNGVMSAGLNVSTADRLSSMNASQMKPLVANPDQTKADQEEELQIKLKEQRETLYL